MKDENGDLLTNSHNILNRRKNYYQPLVPVLIRLEFKIAIAKLKSVNCQLVIKFRQN
jgi:hypothetical protein